VNVQTPITDYWVKLAAEIIMIDKLNDFPDPRNFSEKILVLAQWIGLYENMKRYDKVYGEIPKELL